MGEGRENVKGIFVTYGMVIGGPNTLRRRTLEEHGFGVCWRGKSMSFLWLC